MTLGVSRPVSLYGKVMVVDDLWLRAVAGRCPRKVGTGDSLLLPSSALCCGSDKSVRAGISICKLSATCSQNEKLICLCTV